MKKVLALAAAGLFVLASCKKDYTCVCTASNTLYNQNVKYEKVKKKDAENSCSTYSSQYAAATAGGSCTLK